MERVRPVARGHEIKRAREDDGERGNAEPCPLRPSEPAQDGEVHHAHDHHVREEGQAQGAERGKHRRARQAPQHPARFRTIVRPRASVPLGLRGDPAGREQLVERGVGEAPHARHAALADRLRAARLARAIRGEKGGIGEPVFDEHHAPAVPRELLQRGARLGPHVAQRARHHHRPRRHPPPPDDRRLSHDDEGQGAALGHAILVGAREAHARLRLAAHGLVVAQERHQLSGDDRVAADRALRHPHRHAAGARGDLHAVARVPRDEDRQVERAPLAGTEREVDDERVRGRGGGGGGGEHAHRQLERLRLRGGIRHPHAHGHDAGAPCHVALEPEGLDRHLRPRRHGGGQGAHEEAERGAPRAHARDTASPR